MAYRLLNKERRIFVKKGVEETLRNIRKLIFDFDGVLVQTSQSYRQTILNVVDYYFLEILGLDGEKGKLVTLRDIQKFKDTGLYNNDWNLSYAFITYYINLIMRELEQKNTLREFLKKFCNLQFSNIQDFIQNLNAVGEFLKMNRVNGTDLAELKNDKIVGLDLFLAQASLEKPKPIETSLMGVDPEVVQDEQRLVKVLVPFDLEKPDLLKRLFEEIYLGKELFTKIYEVPAFFNFDKSFLETEEFIPTKETFDLLYEEFGKFGVYSGRPETQGMYILEKYDYIRYFDKNESVFLGGILKSEAEIEKLGKPNPTLFIELIEKFVNDEAGVAYVGDGIADALLIENARSRDIENLLFLGVMSSSEDSNKLFTEYDKHGADVIMTDVNDVPYLLKSLGGDV